MPAWNSTSFIVPVLKSIVAQTYPNLELLISVDECTDGTAELCEEFAASHPNCRVIRQPRRLGWIANANTLLRTADGDYLFFAFHDDPLKPTYVARLVEALERNSRAVLAFCDADTNRGPSSYVDLDGVSDRFERARRLLLRRGDWWVPNRGLFRADAARALGGMRRHLAGEYSADWPWLVRLALMGEFVRVPEVLICKIFRKEGLASTWKQGVWTRVAVQIACLGAVREAGFPLLQEFQLCRERVVNGLKEEWRGLDRRLHGRHQFRLVLCGHKVVEVGAVCLVLIVQGHLGEVTLAHFVIATKTSLLAVFPSLGVTFTQHARHFANKWTSSAFLGTCTFLADAVVHQSHYPGEYTEAALAGIGACVLSIVISYTPIGKHLDGLAETFLHHQRTTVSS